MTFRRQLVWLAVLFATMMTALTVLLTTHTIGYYWSPPNTRDGNGGVYVLNCGFEVRGHVGLFCNAD